MKKLLITTIISLSLVGCASSVSIEQIERASAACSLNGGLKNVYYSFPSGIYTVTCNNDATFILRKNPE